MEAMAPATAPTAMAWDIVRRVDDDGGRMGK